MISAYVNLPKLKENKYFKTWIIKILINKCNKIYKRKKEIKSYSAKIRIEKMNSDVYEREKDKEKYENFTHITNEGDTIYRTDERVRKVWVVVIEYKAEKPPYEFSYMVYGTYKYSFNTIENMLIIAYFK